MGCFHKTHLSNSSLVPWLCLTEVSQRSPYLSVYPYIRPSSCSTRALPCRPMRGADEGGHGISPETGPRRQGPT